MEEPDKYLSAWIKVRISTGPIAKKRREDLQLCAFPTWNCFRGKAGKISPILNRGQTTVLVNQMNDQ